MYLLFLSLRLSLTFPPSLSPLSPIPPSLSLPLPSHFPPTSLPLPSLSPPSPLPLLSLSPHSPLPSLPSLSLSLSPPLLLSFSPSPSLPSLSLPLPLPTSHYPSPHPSPSLLSHFFSSSPSLPFLSTSSSFPSLFPSLSPSTSPSHSQSLSPSRSLSLSFPLPLHLPFLYFTISLIFLLSLFPLSLYFLIIHLRKPDSDLPQTWNQCNITCIVVLYFDVTNSYITCDILMHVLLFVQALLLIHTVLCRYHMGYKPLCLCLKSKSTKDRVVDSL